MESEDRIRSLSATQKLARFISAALLLYICGSFILWLMSFILEKKDIFYRDYSSGFCFATKAFGQELADFYNLYNIPRWTYLGILERYTFTTIFLSAAAVFILFWLFSAGNKERDTGIQPESGSDISANPEEMIPDLGQIQKDFTDLILLDLEGHTKEELFLGLSRFAREKGLVNEEEPLYNSFLEKERRGTTAIGNGIALPEALYARLNRPSAIILCRTKEGVDFGSFDGRPARILLASLNRDKAGSFNAKPAITHLLRFLRDDEYREKILGARTQGDIYRLLKEASSFK